MKSCPVCNRCYEDEVDSCVEDQSALIHARPGECLVDGKYRLERLLAKGGMGAVYAGTHVELERPVAVKLLLPAFVVDPEALERFRREARTAARVSHPNLAELYDYGSFSEGGAYIVMEFIDGRTLREHMRDEGQFPFAEAVSVARQVAEGADAAHRAGIVHRDLKPSNIILKPDDQGVARWQAKIVDFGIAKFMEQAQVGESSITAAGSLVGTPRYMSPEQCLGEEIDERSDIYSLGIILYEMLAGQPPFDAPSETAIALKHTQEPPPSIQYFRPQIPASLAHLVMSSLQKDPALRPQTAAEFASSLLEIERELEEPTPPHGAGSSDRPGPPPPPPPSFGMLDARAVTPALALPATPDSEGVATPQAADLSGPTREITAIAAPASGPHPAPQMSAPETQRESVTEISYVQPRRSRRLAWVVVALLAVLGSGVAAVWLSRQDSLAGFMTPTTAKPTATPAVIPPPQKERPNTATLEPAILDADQQALLKALDEWIEASNASDIKRQMALYAPTLETFYLARNVKREVARDEKERLFGEADSVDVRAAEPVVTISPDGQTAIMRFRKSYVIEGPTDRQGEVLQELRWRKTEDGWKIISERDVRVFR
jgi:serine/threonine-protein kinase